MTSLNLKDILLNSFYYEGVRHGIWFSFDFGLAMNSRIYRI